MDPFWSLDGQDCLLFVVAGQGSASGSTAGSTDSETITRCWMGVATSTPARSLIPTCMGSTTPELKQGRVEAES